jgi:hypothetical protein
VAELGSSWDGVYGEKKLNGERNTVHEERRRRKKGREEVKRKRRA